MTADSIPQTHETPAARPGNPASSIGPTIAAGRYQIGAELARGGMGVIYRAFDTVLNRDVAIKVLRDQFADGSALCRRFVAEAQITGQLQHPGIPPIHDLGTLPDGRPFLAMKLIRGHTLAELLAAPVTDVPGSHVHPVSRERERPEREQPKAPVTDVPGSHVHPVSRERERPEREQPEAPVTDVPGSTNRLAIFEAICQAVGFAHAKGIIHRDLKPANVMVGSFGEVQVMDWGLAKDTRDGPGASASDEALEDSFFIRRGTPPAQSGHQRTPEAFDETRPGDVLGTVPFMPPEQAKGELDRIGPASDVFALGGILCQMLTGKPVYSGHPLRTLLTLAEVCDTSEALARLESCGADPDLIALGKQCLAKDPSARPASAGVLAQLVAEHRRSVDERLRLAELARARAETQATEERKKRRVQRALAAAVLVLIAVAGAFAWWQDRQAATRALEREQAAGAQRVVEAREAVLRQTQERTTRDHVAAAQTLADTLRRQYRFREAEAVLRQAEPLVHTGLTPDLVSPLTQARDDILFARDLDAVRMARSIWRIELGGNLRRDSRSTAPAYRAAFQARGLDFEHGDPHDLAARIAQSPIRVELLAALDDWALFIPSSEAALRDRVLSVARQADPGAWTDLFRDPVVRTSRPLLAWLAWRVDVTMLPPATIAALAELLDLHDLDATALLVAAQRLHPNDYLITFALGQALTPRNPESIAYYRAAVALRPDTLAARLNLSSALFNHRDLDGSIAELRETARRHPEVGIVHAHLGVSLSMRGDETGAIRELREAIRLDPEYAPAHNNLGAALGRIQQYDEALQAFREAIRLEPEYALAHANMGLTLALQGDLDAAIEKYHEALRLDPRSVRALTNMGGALAKQGKFQDAIRYLRQAIAIDPDAPEPHKLLGKALDDTGDPQAVSPSIARRFGWTQAMPRSTTISASPWPRTAAIWTRRSAASRKRAGSTRRMSDTRRISPLPRSKRPDATRRNSGAYYRRAATGRSP